jgi:membrane protein
MQIWRLLKIAGKSAYQNNSFETAKGAAYSGLLSFFPVVTTMAALLVQARADETAHTISALLYGIAPSGTEDIIRNLFVVHGQRPAYLLVVAVALAVWAASSAMASLMGGFQTCYRIPSDRSFLRERGAAILLVFAALVPLWTATALIVFGTEIEREVLAKLAIFSGRLEGWTVLMGQVLADLIAFGALVLATALIYFFGPNRKQTFRLVLPGAVLATLLWLIATLAVGWYLRHVANYNVLYGSVGAGLALLVWMYVLAVIALFGCEFNAALERDTLY